MDWRSIGFDWNRARAFLVTAEEGSFSAAARALGMAQPTIGRQVAALEQELGVLLFERVGASLELTEAGLGLVEHVRVMADAANRVSLSATGQATSIEGTVCITASELVTAFLLAGPLVELRVQHPSIEIELVASNQVRDLQRREADIAIRNVAPTRPDLIARNVGARRARAYASPAYVARVGDPGTPEGLENAELFGFADKNVMIEVLAGLGVALTPDNFSIVVDNHLVQWELTKAGLGICFAMEEVGDAEPRVQRVLTELPPLPVPMWLTAHRELRTSRRIRVVFDLLAQALTTASG
ncbi:MAG: LysR family transcriptional regulator [Myxococcales bacterium]|nr:LysR family transcriptional regulator [Myxococcales bacterium]